MTDDIREAAIGLHNHIYASSGRTVAVGCDLAHNELIVYAAPEIHIPEPPTWAGFDVRVRRMEEPFLDVAQE